MIKKVLSVSWLKKYIVLLLAGFMAGAILCCVFSNEVISGNKNFFAENIKLLKESNINGKDIFPILIEKRFLVLVVLALLGLSSAGKCLMNLFLLWFGAGSGMFVAAFVKLSGIKAVVAALFFFLPQYIIYIPAFGLLYCQIHKFQGSVNWKNREFKMKKRGFLATPFTEYVINLVCLMVMMFIGVVLEAYVNPFLIKKIVMIL